MDVSIDEFCRDNGAGYYVHPSDCTSFIQCTSIGGTVMHCPNGLAYNPAVSTCDWPFNVQNCDP